MSQRQILFPLMVLLLAAAQCGGRAAASNDGFGAVSPDENVRVTIRNDAFWDANIYLLRGAERRRLGTVTGSSTKTFTLQRHLIVGLTELRFIVDWIGRPGGTASESILVEPGDHLDLTIR